MESDEANTLLYQRAHFVTRLPLDRLYSPSHFWLREHRGIWRVGLTKFATRLLGETVDYGFDTQPDASVRPGQALGWIEGFKTVSDLLCVFEGIFQGSNPRLAQDPEAIDRDCYGEGWLYEATGTPDPRCVDAHGYQVLLDAAIDDLSRKQSQE